MGVARSLIPNGRDSTSQTVSDSEWLDPTPCGRWAHRTKRTSKAVIGGESGRSRLVLPAIEADAVYELAPEVKKGLEMDV